MLSGIGIWQLLIVLVIVLLLFGTKRLKGLGGDLGGAIKGFKKAITDDKTEATEEQKRVDDETTAAPSADTKSTEAPVEKTQTDSKQ
ncbi:twin-arginine translocase TatA/TatE family subunit [Marinagarivorans cellulosilyticus]|uniref:Sec-independent protein translocase protein TatA n=1 Tax=Marinagarivorans cellulosilyticus TaxID=2721545 RepID=A0AAN1WH83_9GAMM|nr:twin-arginine translocase TatA/TatE family subunit [Marinagarivorans cellulosilyticus]BCD97556.1 sec-independent protein translocase protein TatA [Marinagarivorans cellulosilyticus]